MIYPKFIKKKGCVGICAPSAGTGRDLDEHIESIKVLKNEGYKVKETKSVRVNNVRSTTAKNRAKELDELVLDKDVDLIMCSQGGDYMAEILPYINFEHIKENPKWLLGASDPTNLLYPVTTKLDIATMYGQNGSRYELAIPLEKRINLDFIKGEIKTQKAFKEYIDFFAYHENKSEPKYKVNWIYSKDVNVEGRMIGGCIDVIDKLIGTPLDGGLEFIDRYKVDGIIWYFDNYSMSVLNLYLTLLKMKYAGYFKNCKCVLFGRVAMPTNDTHDMDYKKAIDKALGKIPHIMDMDIGHVHPAMTMINGAICKVICNSKQKQICYKLK